MGRPFPPLFNLFILHYFLTSWLGSPYGFTGFLPGIFFRGEICCYAYFCMVFGQKFRGKSLRVVNCFRGHSPAPPYGKNHSQSLTYCQIKRRVPQGVCVCLNISQLERSLSIDLDFSNVFEKFSETCLNYFENWKLFNKSKNVFYSNSSQTFRKSLENVPKITLKFSLH